MTDAEKKLISLFRQLTEAQQQDLIDMVARQVDTNAKLLKGCMGEQAYTYEEFLKEFFPKELEKTREELLMAD